VPLLRELRSFLIKQNHFVDVKDDLANHFARLTKRLVTSKAQVNTIKEYIMFSIVANFYKRHCHPHLIKLDTEQQNQNAIQPSMKLLE
jgi:hypothetical protein